MAKYNYAESCLSLDGLDADLRQINPVCLDILCRRGFKTNADIRGVLFPELQSALRPFSCRDIDAALNVLENAVRNGEAITIYRDYDVDGITAGAIAVSSLTALGAVGVHHYVNERTVDGFGICKNGINAILKQWPETRIILTVDNGIAGVDAIEYARSRGLTVIVTDHHEPNDRLPTAAAAIIDPKRHDETYPYKDLCGCGVIFRVMLDLFRRMKKDPTPVLSLLDLVALGTVGDVVPLLGENRALVKEGMNLIESSTRPFFRHMARVFEVKELSAHYTLAFQYVPALNALSRMGEDTSLALEALISEDDAWVSLQVEGFKLVNQARKEATQLQFDLALSKLDTQGSDAAIVIADEAFSEGIIGILAGRLKEKYWKPAIVLAPSEEGILKGSGRSIDEFLLKEALDECAPLLLGFGGHSKAAGLSIKEENLVEFTKKFNELAAKQLAGKKAQEVVELGAVLDESTLTEQFVRDLKILQPYGEGFPEPLFGFVAPCDTVKYMGHESQHVKFSRSGASFSVIAWNMAEKVKSMTALPGKFIGRPGLNVWNGKVSLQFIHV